MKSRLITIPAALFLVSAGLWAQGPRPAPAPVKPNTIAPVEPNTIAPVTNINKAGYPRIHEDLSVSFRIVAPAAAKVQIDLCGVKYDMQRSQDGVWTCVTAPQVPGFHYYSIIVDGVSSADPASDSFYGCGRMSSAIEIPEDGTQDFEIQDVPHGQVRALNYYSEVEGGYRPILVYTPAGYDEGKDSYPVVYIHHGGGEDHTGWMDQGRVANIMDNLIARGEAVPMIVVSPNSNVRSVNGGMAGGGYSWNGMQTYRKELIDNIIPFIEKNFRTLPGAKNRAMCGLSMGGGQSFYIGLRSPETFSNVGVFSTGMFGGIAGAARLDLENEVPGIYSDTAGFNSRLDTFYISCGEQDPRITHTRAIATEMKSKGVNLYFNAFPGDHEWQVWRKSFHEFARLIFK